MNAPWDALAPTIVSSIDAPSVINEARQVRLLVGGFLAGYGVESTRKGYATDLKFWLAYLEDLHFLRLPRL